MAIVVEKGKFKKNPMPEGLHEAVISEVKDIGKRQTQFGEKHYIVARITDVNGKEASRFWTPSLHEKSTLSKDLKSIRGSAPTKLDLESLVGTQVRVLVTETEDKDGEKDARIEKLMKPNPGQNVPVTKREGSSKNTGASVQNPAAVPPAVRSTEITDEDIPF